MTDPEIILIEISFFVFFTSYKKKNTLKNIPLFYSFYTIKSIHKKAKMATFQFWHRLIKNHMAV